MNAGQLSLTAAAVDALAAARSKAAALAESLDAAQRALDGAGLVDHRRALDRLVEHLRLQHAQLDVLARRVGGA